MAVTGMANLAVKVADLELTGHEVVWGPQVVEGAFGTRRISFVNAPGEMRLEFTAQLASPSRSAASTGAPVDGGGS